MDNNDIDVACPSDKRDEPLKEWAARYKRKCTTKSQAPKPGSLVKKESIEESIPSREEESSMPSMSMDLGMGRRSNAMPAIPTMPSMVGMGLGRPSATHTPITVICPWEEFGDVDLKDLAAYGII